VHVHSKFWTAPPVALSDIRQALEDYRSRQAGAVFIVEEFLTQNGATRGECDMILHMFDAHLRLVQVNDRNAFNSRSAESTAGLGLLAAGRLLHTRSGCDRRRRLISEDPTGLKR
jgi:hypothetical protein